MPPNTWCLSRKSDLGNFEASGKLTFATYCLFLCLLELVSLMSLKMVSYFWKWYYIFENGIIFLSSSLKMVLSFDWSIMFLKILWFCKLYFGIKQFFFIILLGFCGFYVWYVLLEFFFCLWKVSIHSWKGSLILKTKL